MVATGTALLARLKLYAVTAQATEIAEQLVKAHVGPASQMGMQQVSKLINTLSTRLMDLSEELLKSDSPSPPATTAAALARKQGSLPACCSPLHPPCRTLTALLLALGLADPVSKPSYWQLALCCWVSGCSSIACNLKEWMPVAK